MTINKAPLSQEGSGDCYYACAWRKGDSGCCLLRTLFKHDALLPGMISG